MKRLLVRDTRYRMSTGDALRHPFITGAPFYPRYASMPAADFDVYNPEEEKDGGGALVLRSPEKYNAILERFVRVDSFHRYRGVNNELFAIVA